MRITVYGNCRKSQEPFFVWKAHKEPSQTSPIPFLKAVLGKYQRMTRIDPKAR